MKWVFWTSVFSLFYIYFGYPALLCLVTKLRPRPIKKEPITPGVSIVIAAYNEEDVICERLENLLNSEYPLGKSEILVSSDGSTDETNRIVGSMMSKYANIRLIDSRERGGKLAALNRAIPYTNNDIAVFTDANTEFEPSAIARLVQAFADPEVGCVSGRKVINESKGKRNEKAEGFYWKYEHLLKQKESLIHSCMGADGSIYAMRKELYDFPDVKRGYADDSRLSMGVVAKGMRLVYERDAKAYESASSDFGREYRRKIRTLSGTLEWIENLRRLLLPFRSPVWWQLWSHRVLRFFIPAFLIAALISSASLAFNSIFYLSLFSLQLLGYTLGICGVMGGKHKIFRLTAYFTFMNFAFISAIYRFLRRKSETAWEKLGR